MCRNGSLLSNAKLLVCVSFMGCAVNLAAQTQASIQAGYGTLTYIYTNTTEWCEGKNGRSRVDYTVTSFTNFSYKDPSGAVTSFPGKSGTALSGGYCTGSPSFSPNPLVLTSTYATTSFVGTAGGGGTAPSTYVLGSLYPKYVVLSVIYAPPGAASSVNYGTSTDLGTSYSWGNSFSSGTRLDVSFTGTTKLPIGGGGTSSVSQSWNETEDSTQSISVDKSSGYNVGVPGPANSDLGVDHDYDAILVWLNPESDFSVTSANSAVWQNAFDPRDPAKEADVQLLYVTWLKNPSTIPPGVASLLARTWAGSGQGLTTSDYSTILARDPFANGQTMVDPTRFDLQAGETFFYEPPACGGQPATNGYTENYTTTSTQGQSATDSYGITYTKSAGISFLNWLSVNFTSSQSLTWTNKWGHQATQQSGQSASVSITGPSDCHYSGATDFQVYRDNVYGTFMFNALN